MVESLSADKDEVELTKRQQRGTYSMSPGSMLLAKVNSPTGRFIAVTVVTVITATFFGFLVGTFRAALNPLVLVQIYCIFATGGFAIKDRRARKNPGSTSSAP